MSVKKKKILGGKNYKMSDITYRSNKMKLKMIIGFNDMVLQDFVGIIFSLW